MSRAEIEVNHLARDAVLRHLGIAGEAAKNVPNEIRALDLSIPWPQTSGIA
jgi:uncharacterized protein with HEPN domain